MLIVSTLLFHKEAFCGQATLAWDPASASSLAGYKVYYGTVSRNYPFAVDAGTQTTATITGLTAGATYYFAATAYDTAGTESAFSSEVTYTVPATNWKIVGIGDFNNDGQPDIFWQHQATGTLSAWLMNGTSLASLATVTPGAVSDLNWKIVGIGDFNNDGKPDILWQHRTTGSLSVWLMNGTRLASLATVTPGGVSDTNWKTMGH